MVAFCIQCSGISNAEGIAPLSRAHAHNDYLHARPLLDALDNGFCSVEADIYLVDSELLVAHTMFELNKQRTLRRLYLDPLRKRVKINGGRVHKNGPVVTLLIDIKANGESTFAVLNKMLSEYDDVFSRFEDNEFHEKAVNVVISGDRAMEAIASANPRYAGIDGRLSDLNSDTPATLLPLISDNWRTNFRWRGEGEIPKSDLTKLNQVVAKAHAKKRRVRFWAIPDKPAVWAALRDAGVDLINTDNLTGLRDFLSR